MAKKPEAPLSDDVEKLVRQIVRKAARTSKLEDGTVLEVSMSDQVRAANLGLAFLQKRGEMDPDNPGGDSEFERKQRAYHDARKGNAADPEAAADDSDGSDS